jgi:hypothetical protein
MAAHHRGHDPVTDSRCGHCRWVFNAFAGTALHGIRRRLRELILIVRGFALWVHADQLAREPDCDRDAGKKRGTCPDPEDSPGRWADAMPGHGTWANDRPPVCRPLGRESVWIRLTVAERTDSEMLEMVVRRAS